MPRGSSATPGVTSATAVAMIEPIHTRLATTCTNTSSVLTESMPRRVVLLATSPQRVAAAEPRTRLRPLPASAGRTRFDHAGRAFGERVVTHAWRRKHRSFGPECVRSHRQAMLLGDARELVRHAESVVEAVRLVARQATQDQCFELRRA